MFTYKTLFLTVLCTVLFFRCDDTEDSSSNLSGVVTNAYTDDPISGATVSILEDGPSTLTDANGRFSFSEDEIAQIEEIEMNGTIAAALSFTHPDFHPRETNTVLGESPTVELNPTSVPSYFYNRPVQLNDGIQTDELANGGVDRQLIQNLMDRLYRDTYNEIHSILIYRNERLVLEEYFFGNNDTIDFENNVVVDKRPAPTQWSRNKKHYVASANKALTSIITGIALDQSNISLTSPISTFLPDYDEYFEYEGKAAISFEDCLTMRANLQWDEWGSNDLSLLWKSNDFASFALSRNYLGAGTEWRYNSAVPNILLKCVDNMVDGNVRDWAHDNFYGKLGITDYNWQYQPGGYPEGSARMYLRPRDMLKIGITYLNNGVWDGEQVVPAQYVQECFDLKVTTPDSGDYSYYFWLRNLEGVNYLSAEGDGGNYINIFPSLDMVIVVTQGLYLRWPQYVIQMDEMMGDYIIPAAAN